MVTNSGVLKLVDYNAMFVPALKHLRAADAGHPHFQLPHRTANDYGPRMDRFPLAVIDLSLEALLAEPALFDQYHRGENLILSRSDFVDPGASPALNHMAHISTLVPRVAMFSDICRLQANEIPSLREFQRISRPTASRQTPTSSAAASHSQSYTSPYKVVDGMRYNEAIQRLGQQVELIGCIQQIKYLLDRDLVLLRFGERYSATPTIVMPLAVYGQLPNPNSLNFAWVSATGVLQKHRSGKFETIQLLVKELSDIEVLANYDEAQFRLGRLGRPLSQGSPKIAAAKTTPPTTTPLARSSTWKITRGDNPADPDWLATPRFTASSPYNLSSLRPMAPNRTPPTPVPSSGNPQNNQGSNTARTPPKIARASRPRSQPKIHVSSRAQINASQGPLGPGSSTAPPKTPAASQQLGSLPTPTANAAQAQRRPGLQPNLHISSLAQINASQGPVAPQPSSSTATPKTHAASQQLSSPPPFTANPSHKRPGLLSRIITFLFS